MKPRLFIKNLPEYTGDLDIRLSDYSLSEDEYNHVEIYKQIDSDSQPILLGGIDDVYNDPDSPLYHNEMLRFIKCRVKTKESEK